MSETGKCHMDLRVCPYSELDMCPCRYRGEIDQLLWRIRFAMFAGLFVGAVIGWVAHG